MQSLGLAYIGVFVGGGLMVGGAAYGIGLLSGSALEGAARQPEALGPLQTMMIIPAAMIEGMGLIGLVGVLLAMLKLNSAVSPAAVPQAAAPAVHAAATK
ncbi:MAG: ATP synthase F0 subunit C [Elusimicrobia bacterium]|nr:ATP synthase F0 subunit C [Elusimicrobiota bacterium]